MDSRYVGVSGGADTELTTCYIQTQPHRRSVSYLMKAKDLVNTCTAVSPTHQEHQRAGPLGIVTAVDLKPSALAPSACPGKRRRKPLPGAQVISCHKIANASLNFCPDLSTMFAKLLIFAKGTCESCPCADLQGHLDATIPLGSSLLLDYCF